MKTPLQQLIDEFIYYGTEKLSGNEAARILKNSLEEEKKQIIQAASCGYFEAREGQHDPDCYGEEYYDVTYQNKE